MLAVTLATAGREVKIFDDFCVRFSCGLISDLCTLNEGKLIEIYSDKLLPDLLNVLSSNDASPESKLHAIRAIGDLLLTTGNRASAHYALIMQVFQQAAIASLTPTEDEDLAVTYSQLRDCLLEGYICILHGITEQATFIQSEGQEQQYVLTMYQYCEAMFTN